MNVCLFPKSQKKKIKFSRFKMDGKKCGLGRKVDGRLVERSDFVGVGDVVFTRIAVLLGGS